LRAGPDASAGIDCRAVVADLFARNQLEQLGVTVAVEAGEDVGAATARETGNRTIRFISPARSRLRTADLLVGQVEDDALRYRPVRLVDLEPVDRNAGVLLQ
jgi:hypothetical protein